VNLSFFLTNPLHHPLLFYSEKQNMSGRFTWGLTIFSLKGVYYNVRGTRESFPFKIPFPSIQYAQHIDWIHLVWYWKHSSMNCSRLSETRHRIHNARLCVFWHIRNLRSAANWIGNACAHTKTTQNDFFPLLQLLFKNSSFSAKGIKEGETGAHHCVTSKWKMAIESEKNKYERKEETAESQTEE
jgi:hypothetical protein